jgi:hypothetical protein
MRRLRLQLLIVVPLSLGALYISSLRPLSSADPVLVGAGDIADCDASQDEATAKLLDSIDGTVFTVGNNVAANGTAAQYRNCYEPTWGRHKPRTRPAPGEHDDTTPDAATYYRYFGDNAGPAGRGYYSYDLGTWHIIALNSETDASASSAQAQWLRDDLAAHPSRCAVAYWHRPVFSSGEHGNDLHMRAIWQILYEHGVEVVISGHDRDYERFAPQDPDGKPDPQGIREFVVGTGGRDLRGFGTIGPNSEVRQSASLGVLKLTLHASNYEWEFVPVAGASFRDSGAASCIRANAEPSTATRLPTTSALPTVAPTITPTAEPALTSTITPTVEPALTSTITPVEAPILASVGTLTPTATPTVSATPAITPTITPTWPMTVIFRPRADTYVGLDDPAAAYGSSSQLLAISGEAEKHSFLGFAVTGLPTNARVSSAKLRLTVINDSSSGGQVYSLSNVSWSETITWQSQPAIDGRQLAALGPVALNAVVEIDVSAVVKGNGNYSFAIVAPPDNRNAVGYASQQNASEASRPQLILVAQNANAPQPEPTLTIMPPLWFGEPASNSEELTGKNL